MKQPFRNIAFCLCALFLFPYGYQALHQLNHAGKKPYHPIHHLNPSCHQSLTEGIAHCPVCEYEFTLIPEPSPLTYMVTVPVIWLDNPAEIPETPLSFSGFQLAQRAPPSMV